MTANNDTTRSSSERNVCTLFFFSLGLWRRHRKIEQSSSRASQKKRESEQTEFSFHMTREWTKSLNRIWDGLVIIIPRWVYMWESMDNNVEDNILLCSGDTLQQWWYLTANMKTRWAWLENFPSWKGWKSHKQRWKTFRIVQQ